MLPFWFYFMSLFFHPKTKSHLPCLFFFIILRQACEKTKIFEMTCVKPKIMVYVLCLGNRSVFLQRWARKCPILQHLAHSLLEHYARWMPFRVNDCLGTHIESTVCKSWVEIITMTTLHLPQNTYQIELPLPHDTSQKWVRPTCCRVVQITT